jgi:copper resistance protein B
MTTDPPAARRVPPRALRLFAIATWLALAAPAAGQVMDSEPHGFALFDQLELAPNRDGTPLKVDALGWFGGDVDRLWVRAETDVATEEDGGEAQLEAFYGRLVSPFWDALVGVRVDHRWAGGSATRAHLALGLQGIAPLWFEVEPTLYVSQDGHVSAQLEAEYELLLTQRTVLQPRLETAVAVQDVPEFGIGSGLTDLELSARLRYELRRELAPYVGVAWHRRTGDTADLARASGEFVSNVSVVVGVRAWY